LIPVVIYSMVITAMLMQSLRRWSKTDNYSFWFVAIGATFFIASDSMIAIDSFYSPINFAPLLIMITYIIAQYMLVTGLLLHKDKVINQPQSDQ
ncbi:MAG TPA: lysoplasmalogenase, partial [Chitinophagales bacterium]|nr:lysoplasmalogenase [Chitinophagales bacterium]